MIIGYSKLGRSWNLDPKKASTVGGDIDVIRLLHRLAWDHPNDTFLLVGRNSGEDPHRLGYPSNVVNPWYGPDGWNLPSAAWPDIDSKGKPYVDEWMHRAATLMKDVKLDQHVMWLGQHGTSNSCLPNIGHDWGDGEFTKPQASMLNYCGYLLQLCNMTGAMTNVQPVLVCPDPRNYIKGRELKHGPKGNILAQYNQSRPLKCDQFGRWHNDGKQPSFSHHHPGHREGSVWVIDTVYEYAGIELTALDNPHQIVFAEQPGSIPVGLISNENRTNVGPRSRLPLVRDWFIKPFPDAPIFGKWSDASLVELDRRISSIPTSAMYDTLRNFRSTITFPASGSGWATAKPWEAFAAGTVMFFHPGYDDQGHILPIRGKPHWTDTAGLIERDKLQALSDYLRLGSPLDFFGKVTAVAKDDALWRKLAQLQRTYFECAFMYWRGGARRVEEVVYDG